MKLSRMIVPKTLLFVMLAFPGLLMPAFAQQEVDPTWYDPWAALPKAAHPQHAKADQKKTPRKLTVVVAGSKEYQHNPVRAHVLHQSQRPALRVALKSDAGFRSQTTNHRLPEINPLPSEQ
jgi:hypothetical protein